MPVAKSPRLVKSPKPPSAREKLALTRANAIGRLLLLARKSFTQRVAQELRAMGQPQPPASFLALSPYIDAAGTRSSELAECVGISKQAVGKLVNEYEQIGLLVREADESDGRAWRVLVTDKGLQLLAQTYRAVARVERHYESLLGPSKFAAVRTALRTIADDTIKAGKAKS